MDQVSERLNRYTCDLCGCAIVTIDHDQGTTPFMINCRATTGCRGTMRSSFYRGVTGKPTHAWRKPSDAEYRRVSPAGRQHYDLGGLELYALDAGLAEGKAKP